MEADLERGGLITQLAHAIKPGTSQPDLVRLGINVGKLKQMGVSGTPGKCDSTNVRVVCGHELRRRKP